ncbi:CotH kinase family protein [Salipaludibacillus daqingensis]|uniref:CotH kinase family protein n=1 Tax=Salipaludibacillus daqingensis TaxID=3041001 RepID=UPI00247345BB|nr:CotH kinase family protein [Salipaludibacillus daqingensis]
MIHNKRIYIIILLLSLLMIAWSLSYVLASGPIIEDEYFEEAIRAEIDYKVGEIRPDQLNQIEVLRIRNGNIENIEGIQHFTSLTSLDLRDNNIRDISHLEELENLQELNLRGNQIKNIDALANLITIRDLNLRENTISDITSLQDLDQLRDVNLRYNEITDLEALRGMGNLRDRLYLEGNPISDFTPISDYYSEIADTDIDLDEYADTFDFEPIFSLPGGFYDNEFDLEITSPIEEGAIYYTLDGSVPDPVNNAEHTIEYTEPITIDDNSDEESVLSNIPTNFIEDRRGWNEPGEDQDKGTVVRALIVDEDDSPSNVTTQSYFVNISSTLPVFSLSTNPDNFFDDEIGIYIPGMNYEDSDGTGNFEQRGREWERPLHVEYYESDGILTFAQDAGVRIHGGFSRRFGQKSLRLYSRSDYGVSRFSHQFFENKEIDDFNRLLLRHSGNDWGMTMFRDAAMQSLIEHLDLDHQSSQSSIVFLNGEYWGIHNLRDRLDKHYLETHYGADRDHFTILSDEDELSDGLETGQQDYQEMISYVQEHSLAEEEHFDYVESLMDVDNYTKYYTTQIYNANSDWPHNNIDFWRYENINNDPNVSDELDGRWRWFLYDVDRSLGYESYDHNTIEMTTSEENPGRDEEWPNVLFRSLLDNEEYQNKFINEMADQLNTSFVPDRVINTIDDFESVIEPEIERHINRWGIPETKADWEEEVEVMREFAELRPDIVRQHVTEHFDLDGTTTLSILSDSEKGTIQLNSIDISSQTPGIENDENWSGEYFIGVPISITAKPNPGYTFAGWGEGIESTSETVEITLDSALTLEPEFN